MEQALPVEPFVFNMREALFTTLWYLTHTTDDFLAQALQGMCLPLPLEGD